jgi:hypothetical protein
MKRLALGSPTARAVAVLVVAFAVSRAVVLALGFRYDVEWLSLSIQNVDQRLLRAHLWQSLWYLHGQPPLWNALVGLSLHTGQTVWPRLWHVAYLALGLIEILALYAALRELRVRRAVAVTISALFSISPAVLVYENVFFYDYPSIVLLTLAALAVARFVAVPSLGRGLAAFGLAGSLVLLRTIFQWPWLLLVVALLLVACRGHRRTVLLSCALPVALVAGVIAKNWVMYGVPSTTTWSGLMLARSAETALPLSERRKLVAEGKLHSVSLVKPLSGLSAYERVGIRPAPRTGIPLLDDRGDPYFPRNLENKTFVHISSLYWHDDLWIIEHRTGAYLRSVGRGLADFFAPPTYGWTGSGWTGVGDTAKIAGYDRWYSRIVYGKLGPGKDGLFVIALYVFAVLAGAWTAVRRLRPGADPATVLLVFALIAIVYLGLVGNLGEVGENFRFRLALDPLALVLGTAGVTQLVAWARRRRSSPSRRPG